MTVIKSQVSPTSDLFRANAEKMRLAVADISDKAAEVQRFNSRKNTDSSGIWAIPSLE